MKRLLLILAILMLPLQSVAAAIDLHCQPAGGAGLGHCAVGFHVDVSGVDDLAVDSDDASTSFDDGDCTLCHMGHGAPAQACPLPSVLNAASPRIAPATRLQPTLCAARPERPNWC